MEPKPKPARHSFHSKQPSFSYTKYGVFRSRRMRKKMEGASQQILQRTSQTLPIGRRSERMASIQIPYISQPRGEI